MAGAFGYQLYGCGKDGPPADISLNGERYRLSKVLKHDFFAATALYKSCGSTQKTKNNNPSKIILKLNRQHHFLGMPLLWLGELICRHEMAVLRRLSCLNAVPHVLAGYGKNGFIYEYIEGQSLQESGKVPQDFFDKLAALLEQIHRHNIIYLDFDKRSNILVGTDNEPYLIDFQISLHIDQDLPVLRPITGYLKRTGQKFDFYHLFKHKRKLCPELLRPAEQVIARRNRLVQLHRIVATPIRRARRRLLKLLYDKGWIITEEHHQQKLHQTEHEA